MSVSMSTTHQHFRRRGTVNGRQGLCINGDCRSDWASVVASGAAWLSTSGVTRLRSATDSVVIGGTTANITGRSFEVQEHLRA